MKFSFFKGRASRFSFFAACILGVIIVYFPLYFCILTLYSASFSSGKGLEYITSVSLSILLIITALSILPVTIRRLHDINLSGWWILSCSILFYVLFYIKQFYIVSILGTIFLLILIFKKGTKGPNRFGEDPLERMDSIDRP